MKEFKKGQTYFVPVPTHRSLYARRQWTGTATDKLYEARGLARLTAESAVDMAKAMIRHVSGNHQPVYPKKMLVWDSDSDPYGKLERTVLGTLRGRYITVEHFGTVLEAAGRAGAATVSFYCHAEDIPETLEDYLSELDLDQDTTDKIIELAKKMKA